MDCLIKPLADKLKKALKDGQFDLARMFDMSPEERRAEFGKVLPPEAAKFVNQKFEKAMASQRDDALKEWVKETTTEKDIKKYNILDKVADLKEAELLDETKFNGLLEDLVSDKLGINLTEEEIKTLVKLTDELKEEREKVKDKDYFSKITAELDKVDKINKFIESTRPSGQVRVLLSTVRRGFGLLASVKSPIVNIVSNTFWGTIGQAERRLRTLQIQGFNSKESYQLALKAWKVFQKTGYDITRMTSIDDTLTLRGEKMTTTQGKGLIRAWGRLTEKYIFNPLYQAPDVVASILTFTDTVRLGATRIALSEGLKGAEAKKRASEIMSMAFQVDMNEMPDEVRSLRLTAMSNAFYYTYTNDSKYAESALQMRDLINKIGNVGVGDALLPFMKTPANVQGAGLQLSGLAGYTAVKNTYQGYQELKKGIGTGKEKFDLAIRSAVQLGLSLFITMLILAMIDDDEYMPDYFTATNDERDFAKQFNIPFNSVRIGNKYVSFDYFGPIAAPVKGALHARKYGKNGANKYVEYGKGIGVQLMSFPGVSDLAEWLDSSKQALSSIGKKDYVKNQFKNGVINFVWSTFVPSIVSDLALATDEYQRTPEGSIDTIVSKIPFLRKKLDIKTNTFGDKLKTEGFLSQFLSGSRVKTPLDDESFNELQRLLDTGYYPNIKDVEKSSQKVKLLKEKIGEEKFNEMINSFGEQFQTKFNQLINSGKYKKMNDEDKKKEIEKTKNDILEKVVVKYGYNKLRKETKK
jgi:hypothetical protein